MTDDQEERVIRLKRGDFDALNLVESDGTTPVRFESLELAPPKCPLCGKFDIKLNDSCLCMGSRQAKASIAKTQVSRISQKRTMPRRFPELDKIVPQNIDDKTEGK